MEEKKDWHLKPLFISQDDIDRLYAILMYWFYGIVGDKDIREKLIIMFETGKGRMEEGIFFVVRNGESLLDAEFGGVHYNINLRELKIQRIDMNEKIRYEDYIDFHNHPLCNDLMFDLRNWVRNIIEKEETEIKRCINAGKKENRKND